MLFSKDKHPAEMKALVPISTALSFDTVKPYIEVAERDYIETILGRELYLALVEYYTHGSVTSLSGSGGSRSEKFEELLERVQRALINITLWSEFDVLNVKISDTGISRTAGDKEKSLYKYQEDKLRFMFQENGFNELDKVLAYLELYEDYFPEFVDSDNYTLRKERFIPDTSTFHSIYNINNSRLVYLRMLDYIERNEEFEVKSVLGTDLYNAIKADMVKDSVGIRTTSLLPYIQKPLVYFSLADSIEEQGVNIRNRSVFFASRGISFPNDTREEQILGENAASLVRKYKGTAENYIQLLKDYLNANSEIYSEWTVNTDTPYHRDNSGKKTVFF